MAPAHTKRPRTMAMVKQKPRGLQDLPAEILEKIFTPVLDQEWAGQMPNLIKALRGDPYLYQTAIAVWYSLEPCYILSKYNNFQFRGMSDTAVWAIRRLKVIVEDCCDDHRGRMMVEWAENSARVAIAPNVNYWLAARGARYVHTLHIVCNPTRYLTLEKQVDMYNTGRDVGTVTVSPLFMFWILFALGFKRLKKITVHFPILSYMHCNHALVHGEGLRLANSILHSEGKLLSVFPYWKQIVPDRRVPRGIPRETGWLWIAEDDKYLDEVLLAPIVKRAQTNNRQPLKERIKKIKQMVRAHGIRRE